MKIRFLVVATLILVIVSILATAAASQAAPRRGTSISGALGAVDQIARDLDRIDARLGAMEQSVAGIDASVKPVGAIAQQLASVDERLGRIEQSLQGIDASLRPVGAVLQARVLAALILLATACAAVLIVLHARLLRSGLVRNHDHLPR